MLYKEIIKKPLRKLGIINKKKALEYRKLTRFLNVKNGHVYRIHQIEFRDGKLFSTGDDPQILIEFNQKTSSILVDYNIEHNNDLLEVFSAKDGVNFAEKDKQVVGMCDGNERREVVPFKKACKRFRLDLVKTAGEINIKKISVEPSDFTGDRIDLRLEKVKKAKNGDGYVIVTHSMDETGAPLLAYNMCKKMKDTGKDVVVVALAGGFLWSSYKKIGVPLFEFDQEGVTDEIIEKDDLDKIARKLCEKGYKRIILNTTISGLTAPYFKKYDCKIMALIHEMKNSIVNYDMEDAGRNANFYADYLVFPDRIVEEEFKSVFGKNNGKTVILPQGFYKKYEASIPNRALICKKYNIPEDAKIIMGSGPMDLRKGADLFFAAAFELACNEKKSECHFVWVGKSVDKNLKNWLYYQMEKVGLKSRIHNIDFIKDMKTYQNLTECADVFWLTSREDPFPSAMIETLRYGTPVIAFKGAGGADTLLSNGRGVLVEDFDARKMADETMKLLGDNDRVSEMVKKAQKYIKENLNFDKYVEKIGAYFDEKEESKKFADLTVVIPNYNYEEYLPMRIRSIVKQTVKPREIIFLDDNSTDKSAVVARKILEEVQERYGIKYKIIKNDDNQGCFKQWIKGIHVANYDFVWIAEADDYAGDRLVESLMPKFDDKEVVLSYAKSCVIDGNSVVVDYDYNSYVRDLDDKRWEADFVCSGEKFVREYLSQKNVIPNASSVIFRKKVAEGIDSCLSEYEAIGDWFFYIYIVSRGKVAYKHDVMNGHRRHGASIIAKQEKSVRFIKEMIMIKKYLIENFTYNDRNLNDLMVSFLNENADIRLIESNEELREAYKELVALYSEKKKKENLLIIVPDLEVGGGQAVGIRFANYFTKYYDVFIVSAREQLEMGYMREMISSDVKILKYEHDVERLKFWNKTLRFKAVLSLIWWSDKLSYMAFKDEPGIKRIISMHGCYEKILDYPEIDTFFDANVKDMLESAAHVVYTAEKNRRVFEAKNVEMGDRLVKIDNGFLLGDFPTRYRKDLGIGDDDFVFGLVARGIPEKGYEQAIEGLLLVNEKSKKKCHLVLVGSGEYIDELKKKYCSPYIHFVDNTTEPLEWIGFENIFDVGLLPSYFESESMPTAIIEMLFLSKPIIATDIGEIKSMLTDGNNKAGIVIPLRNGKPDQEKLNEAMLELANNPDAVKELAKDTEEMSKRFDMDKCIDRYRELIED